MQRIFLRALSPMCVTIAMCVLTIAPRATAQTHLWSQRFGDTDFDFGWCISVEASGDFVASGDFAGTVDFGGGGLTSAGSSDFFVARYNGAGDHVWSKRFGGTGFDAAEDVAVDDSGNVYVTGSFSGTIDLGGGPLVSNGGSDIFVAKLDAAGAHIWSQSFGDNIADMGLGISADTSGVVVTGHFAGTVDFGGGGLSSAGGSQDIFVARFASDGTHRWSKQAGSTGEDNGTAVSFDPWGNVFVTGFFNGAVDFGAGPLNSSGMRDIFLVKYDPDGVHLLSRRFGGTDHDGGFCLGVDGGGNIVVTGYFDETADFGGGPLTSAGGADIFVARYSSVAVHIWSHRFGGPEADVGTGVYVDAADNVFLTGHFSGTVDFGGGGLTSAGFIDIFLARFDEFGVHSWSERFGGTSHDIGGEVAADASGDVCLSGSFQASADFGGGDLTSAGFYDIVLAKYAGTPVAVAISSFDARAREGRVVLHSSFASNLQVHAVNIYRAEGDGRLRHHRTVPHSAGAFSYDDHDVEPGHTYRYQIGVVDDDGEFLSPVATVSTKPYTTALLQNTPNPFNPVTTIHFSLENPVHVTLAIYDASGRRVATLVDGVRSAGPHAVQWGGLNTSGATVSSGVYFYLMRAGKTAISRRMVLLK
jgi:hypothetical protein